MLPIFKFIQSAIIWMIVLLASALALSALTDRRDVGILYLIFPGKDSDLFTIDL